MTDITIIGSGNMARAIGTRAVAAGRSVQILDRTPENAAKLAAELGGTTGSGGLSEVPEGDIVVLALYFGPAKEVATHFGDTLSGKTVVEISNPIDTETFDALVVAPGTSAADVSGPTTRESKVSMLIGLLISTTVLPLSVSPKCVATSLAGPK